MDRIAVISDIHGNIPALDAVMQDIKLRGISRIFCLGDMVGKGPHSEIAIDRVRSECELVVKGNWEDKLATPRDVRVFQWHQHRLGPERIEYMKNLPFSVQFLMSGKMVRLFHASARSLYHRVYPYDSLYERLGLFDNTAKTGQLEGARKPDVVGYGDIHTSFVQHFKGKTLFNPGSVGNPLDFTQASYAILEGEYGGKEQSSFSIQLVRLPYDIELAIRQAREENMPKLEEYIKELRTAVYRGHKV